MIELYLISVLSSLGFVATIVAAISGIGFLISGVAKQISDPVKDSEDYKASCNVFKVCKPIFIAAVLLTILIPSKRQLYMIFGVGPVIDNIQESEVAKQLPDKTLQVLDKWCNSYLKSENKQN